MKLSSTQKAVLNSLRAHCRHRGYSPGSWIYLPEGTKWPRIGTLRAMARKGVIEFSEECIVCQRDKYLRLLSPYTVEKPNSIPVHHLVLEHDDYETLQRVLLDIDMYYEMVIKNRHDDVRYDEAPIVSLRNDAKRLRTKLSR